MTPEALQLGIAPREKRIPAQKCLNRMQHVVLWPMLLLIVAAFGCALTGLSAMGLAQGSIEDWTSLYPGQLWKITAYALLFAAIPVLLAPSILWVVWATQKWRVWALRNVDSWPLLQQECEKKFQKKWPRKQISNATTTQSDKVLEQRLIAYRDRYEQSL